MAGLRLLGGAGLLCLLLGPVSGKAFDDEDKKQDKEKVTCRIVYVPTEQEVVGKMLVMARVKKGDVVFDLGCGDGRIVATAAKKYGARGVGVDIDPERIADSRKTVKKFGVEKLVEIREGNALKVKDFDRASVVTLYMLPEFMEKLEPIARKVLKPGARIVAHDFPFPTWKAEETVDFKGPDREHRLFLYVVREKSE